MKTRILIPILLCFLLIGRTGFSQNQENTVITDSMLKNLEEALKDLSDYYVKKVEDSKFKVETFDGEDITFDVKALKSPNGADLLFYDPEADWTSICLDFYDVLTVNDEWIPTELMPETPTGIYWIYSNDYKSYYFIQFGGYLDMSKFSLKSPETNNNDLIVSENGVEKYIIRDLAGKSRDEFYPLELLEK